MLQNAYLLAKIGADTAENEQQFAEILRTDALRRLRVASAEEALGPAVAAVGPAPAALSVPARHRFRRWESKGAKSACLSLCAGIYGRFLT